ncbi:MAG: metallophosphoesterase [Candidatus Solibacter sp.]
MMRRFVPAALALVALALFAAHAPAPHFVLLGDRTGEVQAGIFEGIWRQISEGKAEFVVSVGDSIQGGNDATAESEWRAFRRVLEPYNKIPLYLSPGNHDIWSAPSERLFQQYAAHPPHYSFDAGGVHFTVLDNSRSDGWPPGELAWLESDLRAHSAAPVKFVVSHRPSWLLDAALGNANGPLQKLTKQYGICCVIAGHVHQLIHAELDGVRYIALPSAGGHLRLSGKYEDGWFFGWTEVAIKGREVSFQVHQLDGPVTPIGAWGRAGLAVR